MNLRPPRPERGALPDCATLRLMAGLITLASLKASLREAMTAEPGTRVLTADDKAFSKTALDALGWQAVQSQREKTAQAWVANGLLAFLTVISVKDADFANHSFQPPQALARGDGTVAVTLWIRLPSGRVRGTRYELREYRFSAEGNLAGATTLENFTAPNN